MSEARRRLEAKGLQLPAPRRSSGSYVGARSTNGLLYVSGQTTDRYRGTVGIEVSVEDAKEAAADAALNVLALAAAELGDLDRVAGVVKVVGFVACGEPAIHLPSVIDGASAVFETAFGSAGRHARSAVGVRQLPKGSPVEVEAVLEVLE